MDALSNPLGIVFSVGQQADIKQTEALLANYETDAVIADRGYEADSLLNWLGNSPTEAVIAAKKNRFVERSIDANLYKDRNKVERYFNKLKQYRQLATRYDKTAATVPDSFT
ncbi:transposase [Spirosoma fluminis]